MDDDDISYRLPEIIEVIRRRLRLAGYCALALAGVLIVWCLSP